MVEVNEGVVEASKKYLPFTASGLTDPRVTIYTENCLRYIRHIEQEYDVIIVDSAGFYGPGESLLSREFYGSCYKALKEDGIMVNQHQSPFTMRTDWKPRRRTSVLWRASPSAEYTRHTFRPILPATGCLDLLPRSITR